MWSRYPRCVGTPNGSRVGWGEVSRLFHREDCLEAQGANGIAMSVLIKELIHTPEKVQRRDFVLNLASGLAPEAIEQTLAEYVVTPQLARCFEDALSFAKSAVTSAQNRNRGV